MPLPRPIPTPKPMKQTPLARLQSWWHHLAPHRQDRFAVLAPLAAVMLFLAAIVAAFSYLRLEEIDREQEAVQRDVEYTHQRLRLRLLERQEQLMRIAREVSNGELNADNFQRRAEALVNQYPELQGLTWIDAQRRIRGIFNTNNLSSNQDSLVGNKLKPGETDSTYPLAKELQQPNYSQSLAAPDVAAVLQLHIPLNERTHFLGVLLAEYSVDGLFRYGVPPEVSARYAISFHDAKRGQLAGISIPARKHRV